MPQPERDDLPELREIFLPWFGYVELSRRFWLYVSLIALLLLGPPLALAVFLQTFNADAYRPRIAAALQQVTGQRVEIRGPVTFAGILTPKFSFGPVAVDGATTGSRLEIARIDRVEVQLALWPLLWGRPEIQQILIDAPDILLERDDVGRGNWLIAGGTDGKAAPIATVDALLPVRAITVRDGRFTWRDRQRGVTTSFGLKRVLVTVNGENNLAVSTDVTLGHERIVLNGQFGALARLLNSDATTPWPVNLTLQARGANLSVQGSLTNPMHAAGYRLQVDGAMRESRNFRALLPDWMPALRDLALSVLLTDVGTPLPDLAALSLQIGESDLGAFFPGGRLDRFELHAGGMQQALHGALKGVIGGAPLHIAAVLGTPAGMLQAAVRLGWLPGWTVPAPARAAAGFPIDLVAALGDSELTASGAILSPARLEGLDLSVSATLRNLEKLEPVLRQRMPRWESADLHAHVIDLPTGVAEGLAIQDLAMTIPYGDLTGTAAVHFGRRPAVEASLRAKQFDFDGFNSSISALHFGPPPPLSLSLPPGSRLAPALFHDRPMALGGLDIADLDMRLDVANAHIMSLPVTALATRIQMQHGVLTVDPLTAQTPGGAVAGTLRYDTRAIAAPLHLQLRAPALSIRPLLVALQMPEDISGALDLDVDMAAEGRTPHALLASLTGRAGVALVDGELDTRMFTSLMYGILLQAHLPMHLLSAGLARARCFAATVAADHGVVTLASAVLDSERLLLQATGSLQGTTEFTNFRLRPQLRLGGPAVSVPLRIIGPLSSLHLVVDPTADAEAARDAWRTAAQAAEQHGADPCPAALRTARNGRDGPMPTDQPTAVTPIVVKPESRG